MKDQKYMKAIAECNKRINEVERKIDAFFNALHVKNADDIISVEDAVIENDIATNERITEIEDAILELDEAINGGADNG